MTNIRLSIYLAHFLERKMFQTNAVEKIETRISCPLTVSENRAVNEIIWKNAVERKRIQMTIWCMRIARRIPTNTHSRCVTRVVFPLQKWLHECACVLLCKYIASVAIQLFSVISVIVLSNVLDQCYNITHPTCNKTKEG